MLYIQQAQKAYKLHLQDSDLIRSKPTLKRLASQNKWIKKKKKLDSTPELLAFNLIGPNTKVY